jgi:hypothetical protein
MLFSKQKCYSARLMLSHRYIAEAPDLAISHIFLGSIARTEKGTLSHA